MYSVSDIAKLCNVTTNTVRNWVASDMLIPAVKDGFGSCEFSDEQYEAIKENLPCPRQGKLRKQWLDQFSVDGETTEMRLRAPDFDPIPSANNQLYQNANREKISAILQQSNKLFEASLSRPQCNLNNLEQVISSTRQYFVFCEENGIMPEKSRLANWLGYSSIQLNRVIEKESDVGVFLARVEDVIKSNLEQGAINNAVNPVFAMFLLKTKHDYVEATKHIIAPTDSLLGQPKSPEEIADYIEADIVED